MKFAEALHIGKSAGADVPPFSCILACGFTPLHLQTFLAAYLQRAFPKRKVRVRTGLFGDLVGTIESAGQPSQDQSDVHALAIALEWQDLDPRLGHREGGLWGPAMLPQIVEGARTALDRISAAIKALPTGTRVAVCLPTLPLPPLFHTPGWQTSEAEAMLDEAVALFASRQTRGKSLGLVNTRRLDVLSPASSRYHARNDLLSGLPYTMAHADAVAELLSKLLIPRTPKKAVITDLDDTLWYGIVGETGPEGVLWDLASHRAIHGLYQKLLGALAEEGVLIGVASKNDPAAVERVFARRDLLFKPDRIFPMEVHWNAKSGSVENILRVWNISADSVVFIDDSPMELAEVAAVHPGIECLLFPRDDTDAALAMLRRLRDLCGKGTLSSDDSLRLDSIRQGAAFQRALGSAVPEDFLRQLDAIIGLDFQPNPESERVLELVNKTNQFNLNGVRYTQADWRDASARAGAITVAVSYEDRYGPLGTIGVIQGRLKDRVLYVDVWVMSCRAFARRIEHQCLRTLFEKTGAEELILDFRPTAKNAPLRAWLREMLSVEPSPACTLSRTDFERNCPTLYHRVVEVNQP